jgi:hypothetical protein
VPRRAKESTRIRRKRSLLVPGLAAAAVAALAVGIALASGGPSPEEPAPAPVLAAPRPAPPPAPPPSPEALLAKAREIREADLLFERRAHVLELLRQAGPRADRVAAEYDHAFEETAARLADFARSEALRHSARQKYAEAIASLDGYPEAFRASRAAGPLRELRKDLERRRTEAAGAPAPAVRTPAGTSPIVPYLAEPRLPDGAF